MFGFTESLPYSAYKIVGPGFRFIEAKIYVLRHGRLRAQSKMAIRAKIMSSRKRKRSGKDADVEEALNQWLRAVLARSVRISGPMLKAKAEEFARRL